MSEQTPEQIIERANRWIFDRARGKSVMPEQTPELHEPAAWIQIQAGNELRELVEIIRTPGQASAFLHSSYDANGLIWRWFLKWYPQATIEAQGRPRRECVCHFEDGLVQEWMAKVREVARSKGWRPGAEAQPLPAREEKA